MKTESKPLVIPKSKPRNPLAKHRKSTVLHQDKRSKQKHKRPLDEDLHKPKDFVQI